MAYHLIQHGERERIRCKRCGSVDLELRTKPEQDPRFVRADSHCRSCDRISHYTWTAPVEIVPPQP